jgi:phospholipid/cholesterol/gamma-HCH transport system permease protein
MATLSPRPGEPRTSRVNDAVIDGLGRIGAYEAFETAGGMAALGLHAFAAALKPPFSWWRPMIVEASKILRRCLFPLAICLAVFVIGFGFFVLAAITKVIGATDREGGAFIIGFVRECCVWTTGMVFSGVAGSAITADLAARKVREEIDALNVLGVDVVDALVVPKLMACLLCAPVLGMMAVLFTELMNFALAPGQFGFSRAVLFEATKGSLISLDVFGALIRYIGRAVNQTVVICFFFVWILDALFNLAYLSLFPQTQVDFKG